MGLLDFTDPQSVFLTQLGAGLLSAGGPSNKPVSLGQAFGATVPQALQGAQAAEENRQAQLMRQLQMAQLARKQQKEDQQTAYLNQLGASISDPQEQARFRANPEDWLKSYYEGQKPMAVAKGGAVFQGGKSVFTNPDPEIKDAYLVPDSKSPSGWRADMGLYNLAKEIKKAGATNVTQKAELKTGESLASQVGPMLKSSKDAVLGAVKMDDAANRVLESLDNGSIYTGPLANAQMKVDQLLSQFGGDTTKVENTRKVLRALAESSVEARKELAGQGQVTDSEAAAVEKAMSGRIEDLTVPELRLIANLNKRAAAYRARSHQDMLANLPAGTENLRPFYAVRGIDKLLNYRDPEEAAGSRKTGGAKFLGFE